MGTDIKVALKGTRTVREGIKAALKGAPTVGEDIKAALKGARTVREGIKVALKGRLCKFYRLPGKEGRRLVRFAGAFAAFCTDNVRQIKPPWPGLRGPIKPGRFRVAGTPE